MNRSRISSGNVKANGVFASGHAAIMCAVSYAKRTELGMLAPGVITRPKRRIGTPAQRRELVRWLQLAVVAMALVGGTALVSWMLARLYFGA